MEFKVYIYVCNSFSYYLKACLEDEKSKSKEFEILSNSFNVLCIEAEKGINRSTPLQKE